MQKNLNTFFLSVLQVNVQSEYRKNEEPEQSEQLKSNNTENMHSKPNSETFDSPNAEKVMQDKNVHVGVYGWPHVFRLKRRRGQIQCMENVEPGGESELTFRRHEERDDRQKNRLRYGRMTGVFLCHIHFNLFFYHPLQG